MDDRASLPKQTQHSKAAKAPITKTCACLIDCHGCGVACSTSAAVLTTPPNAQMSLAEMSSLSPRRSKVRAEAQEHNFNKRVIGKSEVGWGFGNFNLCLQ